MGVALLPLLVQRRRWRSADGRTQWDPDRCRRAVVVSDVGASRCPTGAAPTGPGKDLPEEESWKRLADVRSLDPSCRGTVTRPL